MARKLVQTEESKGDPWREDPRAIVIPSGIIVHARRKHGWEKFNLPSRCPFCQ